ncbi:uncharacterized protein EI90DRAFT_561406 [Cantharellus anzutake]|uniref:uncharacterized protein n=1 Tax=Cantharellus anzutake TaxID=1750568 RepID=UPI001906865D|nr:uncharacterized protein EI90DRAFT_561406 [Cantharellus anzutake]KAF8333431.1 hypothetical protein EI90DRAFT_561406 [Cantharellus anzutake]
MPELSIEISVLSQAAAAAHDLLTKHKLSHAFFGGFALVTLEQPSRTTKDVDVEIAKSWSLFGTSSTLLDKVKAAFKSEEAFLVIEGTREDALRVIWNKTVGVDVFMREGRMPRSVVELPVALPHDTTTDSTPEPRLLPFFKPTDLLVEKRVDLAKAKKRLNSEEIDAAKNNYPHMATILNALADE